MTRSLLRFEQPMKREKSSQDDSLVCVQAVIKVAYAGVNGGCETFRARGEFA